MNTGAEPPEESWLERARRQQQEQRAATRFHPAVLVRLVVYLLILSYLGWDLVLARGPLHRAWAGQGAGAKAAAEAGAAARAGAAKGGDGQSLRVIAAGISREELRAEIVQRGWLSGEDYAKATDTRRLQLRREAMEALVVRAALQAQVAAAGMVADPATVEAEWQQSLALWGGPERAARRLAEAGWSEAQVRQGIADQQAGAAWLEGQLAPELAKIDEAAALAWFQQHPQDFVQPRRARFAQVFAATLRQNPESIRAEMAGFQALGRRDPANLARALVRSEDERSKTRGGDLGWIEFPEPAPDAGADPLPAGLRQALSDLPDGGEALVRSDIGWHWIWLTGPWEAARQRSFAEVREEILGDLRQQRRRELLKQWRGRFWAEAAVSPGHWAAELDSPWPGLPPGARSLEEAAIVPQGVPSAAVRR